MGAALPLCHLFSILASTAYLLCWHLAPAINRSFTIRNLPEANVVELICPTTIRFWESQHAIRHPHITGPSNMVGFCGSQNPRDVRQRAKVDERHLKIDIEVPSCESYTSTRLMISREIIQPTSFWFQKYLF